MTLSSRSSTLLPTPPTPLERHPLPACPAQDNEGEDLSNDKRC
jgi:hypothetical protein